MLVNKGANLNYLSSARKGEFPAQTRLSVAAMSGNLKFVEYLLQKGPALRCQTILGAVRNTGKIWSSVKGWNHRCRSRYCPAPGKQRFEDNCN
jgi:hypothetical protein